MMSRLRAQSRSVFRSRRDMLAGGTGALLALALGHRSAALAEGSPGAVPTLPAPAEPFGPDVVKRLASTLASAEFQRPKLDLPAPFSQLTYDQYRDIRFKTERSIWRSEKLDYQLQLFPMGFLYDIPVEIWLVEGGQATRLKADSEMYTLGPLIEKKDDQAPYAFSGLRVHGPLNRSDYFDEFAVFQGASYFRAVARGQVYGMSGRGLAINTARPAGEEFPFFRSFWVEKPKPGASDIVIHALLDSPSTTGAYRFAISPGTDTVMDVDMTLYPRKPLSYVGIAPLTSMFLHGTAFRRQFGDFRPEVHDSEGLVILNGNGERLWRPLTNPKKLQSSAFMDKDPKGFGLSQRDRTFVNFEDLEAHYERRPSVWVEPKGAWGAGNVELIEIPAEEEIHDNIVVFWKPAADLAPGGSHGYSYRLHWTDAVPVAWTGARVRKTYAGNGHKAGNTLFVVDFEGPALKDLREMPIAEISASAGQLSDPVVQPQPEIGGVRTTFELTPGGSELIELRLALKNGGQLISESWLYRWTKV